MITPSPLKRTLFFLFFDFMLSLFTLFLAYNLRFNFEVPGKFWGSFEEIFILLVGLKLISIYLFRGYAIIWRFFGFADAKNLISAHLAAYFIFALVFVLFSAELGPFARSILMIDFFLSIIFLGALRSLKRLFVESFKRDNIKPCIIFGANSKASTIIQSALRGEVDYYPIGIIAQEGDAPEIRGYLNNVKVYDADQLESFAEQHEVTSAIFTRKMPQDELKKIVSVLNGLGIYEIKVVRLLGSSHEKLEDLSIEDLLARHPKDLDLKTIESFVKNKTILITGAGGSIGSEIAKQCHQLGAARLVLVDHSEYNLYAIAEQLPGAVAKLLNITNTPLLEKVFDESRPQIVIHAAAYKHVHICETNPQTAVFNNVYGSKNVIDVSIKFSSDKVVLISTDKAVRPTNVMGATKRVAELYAGNVESKDTEIVAVRFGNVLGSSGSVIPKFKQQIESGGPVTVTHPDITRYFMLIPEACQLVLQAAAIGQGGELFILDMGDPVKIIDLAKQMIRLYGKEDDIEIRITGLRPGEKLFEELLLNEAEEKTRYSSIFSAHPTPYDITTLQHDIDALLKSDNKIIALKKIVPEFSRNN